MDAPRGSTVAEAECLRATREGLGKRLVRVRPRMVLRVAWTPELRRPRDLARLDAIRARWLDRDLAARVLRPGHDDRARRVSHDVLGYRAEEEPRGAAPPVRTDDHRIGADLAREIDDLVCLPPH